MVPNPADGIPWIGLLIVHAGRQGRGLGREAVRAIERRLARDGWPELRLAVLASNPRARRFWERLGYRQVDGCWRAYDGRARAGATLGKAIGRRRAAVRTYRSQAPGGGSPGSGPGLAAIAIRASGIVATATGRVPRR
jgi:GNAT superfamily N-acetyltransferase